MDDKVTLDVLKNDFRQTRKARNWKPTLKSLAISISLEASELLEHFQWDDDEKVANKMKISEKRREIVLEVGDILNYLCEFASQAGIDLSLSAKQVIEKIDQKYPVHLMKNDREGKHYEEQKKKYRDN